MTTALNKGQGSIEEVQFVQDTLHSWALDKDLGLKVA